jgi:peroxiredoxin
MKDSVIYYLTKLTIVIIFYPGEHPDVCFAHAGDPAMMRGG